MAWNNHGNQRGGGNQQNYPNSGALFSQQKKSQNAPDMNGNIVISEDVLDYILRMANQGEVKLELSGWRRQAQSGVNFLSLKIQTPYAERQQQDTGYRPQQNFRRGPPQGDRQERAQYGSAPQRQRPAPNPYAQAKGGYGETGFDRGGRRGPAPMSDEQFKAGDQMPDFMLDSEDDDPNNPPF